MNIELPLDGKQRQGLRPLSRALFQSQYALEAYLLIASSERFYKAQLAEVTGCQPSYATSFLRRLESVQLVERLPTEEGQQRQYLRKAPSPIWDHLVSLADSVLEDDAVGGGGEVTPLPRRS